MMHASKKSDRKTSKIANISFRLVIKNVKYMRVGWIRDMQAVFMQPAKGIAIYLRLKN